MMSFSQPASSFNLWANLPDSLLLRIFGLLSPKDIIHGSEVCRNWYRVSRDELLWKHLLQSHSDIGVQDILGLLRAPTWLEEFKWIHLNTPLIESQVLKMHTDEVLHVAFSHDGQLMASSSKDCSVILWLISDDCRFNSKDTCKINFAEHHNWDYVQLTEFNSNDTLLLVSGTKKIRGINFMGEIIIFKIEKENTLGVQLIHEVESVPYDVYGAWLTERSYISGNFEFAPSGADHTSVSELCLNYVDKPDYQTTLAQVIDYNCSSVRTLLVAKPLGSQENDKFCLIFTHGTLNYVPHQIMLRWIQRKTFADNFGIDQDLWQTLEEHCIETNGHINGMKLSLDQQYLYVNCRRWQWQDEKPKAESCSQDSPPDISNDITMQVYSLSTYEMVNVHFGHQAFTGNDVCFFIFLSVADRLVASGAEDHHAHVWHRCGGSKLATLKGHVNVVNCVAFSPANQQMLVSASDDHTIRVWKSRQLARLHKDDQPEQQRDLFRESTV